MRALNPNSAISLIGDLVLSREHDDQKALFLLLDETLTRVNQQLAPLQPLAITIGDEFQGAFGELPAALEAALQVQLRLKGSSEVRIGLGWGEIEALAEERLPLAQTGTAWWSARAALERVASLRAKKRWPNTVRTLIAGPDPTLAAVVNAHLLCSDHLVAKMSVEDAKITLGLLRGASQNELGEELGISQASISRRQVENGPSTLYRAHKELEKGLDS